MLILCFVTFSQQINPFSPEFSIWEDLVLNCTINELPYLNPLKYFIIVVVPGGVFISKCGCI